MTLAEIAHAVHGTVHDASDPHAAVAGPVVVDSRRPVEGGLFVAVAGERVDGHDFAAAAVTAGAAAVLAQRPVGVPAVVVDDTVAALGRLAHAAAARLTGVTVVGITGSAGKTGTKDLLAQLLPALGPTVAPPESYNNDIGFPLTVLRADADTAYLVLELGARGPGHIRRLCEIVPPDVGLVLNVGTAHLGEFGSREAIAAAKGELPEAVGPDGLVVLNADDDLVLGMAARTRARTVRFGIAATGAEVRAADVRLDGAGRASFDLVTLAGTAPVTLGLYGEHQVVGALGAAAVALHLGLGVDAIAAGLSRATPRSRWRMEVSERPDGVTIVNDAYNANPASLAAALQALARLSADGRRSVAVLGEMLELGETGPEEHRRAGVAAAELGVDVVLAVGDGARGIADGAASVLGWPGRAEVVPDGDAAERLLAGELRPGDVVLFKSSRDAGLRWVGDRVAAAAGEPVGSASAAGGDAR